MSDLKLNERPDLIAWRGRTLDAAMDNLIAWRMGQIVIEAADPKQSVGDYIDRGLILLRLLNEAGLDVVVKR